MSERLQKILSARGICSRRKAEEYILAGLVKVNGKVAELGQKADPEADTIEVDGKVLEDRQEMLYYVMNKPVGVETSNRVRDSGLGSETTSKNRTRTRTPNPNPIIRDLLPSNLQGTLFPVGRLDKDTSGLLLLTNDGVLAYRLTHPKFDHEKEYEVEVEHDIKDGQFIKLEKGMTISGEKTKPATIKRIAQNKFSIALTEGKNRQIRRMCQKVGAPVKTLRRTRIMTLRDEKLKEGELRSLSEKERKELLEAVGL